MKKPRGRKFIEIGLPDTETDRAVLPGWNVSISEYFSQPGVVAVYRYDFGDGWCHEVLLEGILIKSASVKYPSCIAGERACPPEDCGGTPGYKRLLEVLMSPGTEEYKDMNSWLKGHVKNYFPYKPESFDPKEVEFWSPEKRLRMAFGEHE